MNVLKKMKFGVVALSMATVFTACSSDDDSTNVPNQGHLKIAAKASYSPVASRGVNSVNLGEFLVNFKEIELELQDGFYDSDDDIELKGPFEIDLFSGNSVQLVDIEIPNGIYEEIEFEFDKSENPNSDLFGRSMQMTGEINGQAFIFWHDFEDEIEIDYEDSEQKLVINNDTKEVVINFDLNAVLGMVDLSTATDGDGDGVIVISPEDMDGNNDLAEAIKEAFKVQIDLLDD
ncbi:DUF4382 domain-containing protein [Gelidibacter maritimus]|uniref:DUF4382 domain-containing protein n=1 Tax=Gelidibacter maritimus TaxID=2761487 RepID=A0A7W2M4V1_9FLAO|nr:DUF4382 domain-containing protein [Gelidibacter maritimus]MBA6152738.1 DUF4382 domain-containing protein [Gelidibacter maritimus]